MWRILALLSLMALAACGGGGSGSGGSSGGGSATYTVSVMVSGLQPTKTAVLQNNGLDNLAISANGTMAFSAPLSNGAAYSVTVETQPVGQSCAVVLGKGTINNNDILVALYCSTNSYTVGGTVSGLLPRYSVTLQDGQGVTATIKANGSYTFSAPIASASTYYVAVVTSPYDWSCTVANASGIIAGSNITNANVSCAGVPYSVSVEVIGLTNVSGLVLQDNGGDNLAINASSTYSFKTPVLVGQNYNVTILTQPAGHTCNVLNGSGTVSVSDVIWDNTATVVVACPWHVGYQPQTSETVAGEGIAAYYIDQRTGATVAHPGNPYGPGIGVTAMVVSPTAGFLYATSPSATGSTILAYAIDPIDGSLTAVAGSPFPAGDLPNVIATDPQGRFLYVGNSGSNNISAFAINPNTGALTAIAGSPFAMEGSPLYLAVSAVGFVYAGYQDTAPNARVSAFALNPGTGALSEIAGSPFLLTSFAPNPWAIGEFAIDPLGRFFYLVGTNGSGYFSETGFYAVSSIDSMTGALAPAAGSPFALPYATTSAVIDRTGSYLYGDIPSFYYIYEYAINPSTGVLTTLGLVDGAAVTSVDPSNTFLFAYYYQDGYQYTPYCIIHSSGSLIPCPSGPAVDAYALPTVFSNTP